MRKWHSWFGKSKIDVKEKSVSQHAEKGDDDKEVDRYRRQKKSLHSNNRYIWKRNTKQKLDCVTLIQRSTVLKILTSEIGCHIIDGFLQW